MLNLGVRAHDFGRLPLEILSSRIAAAGFSCVQFAPTKAIEGFDADEGRLSPGFAVRCRQALAREGLGIAVLGCYINLSETDDKERRAPLARFRSYLRLARDFGCSLVGTESGSLNRDFSWHPDNHGEEAYVAVVENMAHLLAAAESFGSCIAIEGVAHYTIHSPQRIRRLLDDLGSEHVQVILDPVNLLNAENHEEQDRIIRESFDLLGDRIAAAHLKDFVIEAGRFRSVAAGTPGGLLQTGLFLSLLEQAKPGVQVLLEDTQPETIARSVRAAQAAFPGN